MDQRFGYLGLMIFGDVVWLVGDMVVENQTECLPSFTRLVGQRWNL